MNLTRMRPLSSVFISRRRVNRGSSWALPRREVSEEGSWTDTCHVVLLMSSRNSSSSNHW